MKIDLCTQNISSSPFLCKVIVNTSTEGRPTMEADGACLSMTLFLGDKAQMLKLTKSQWVAPQTNQIEHPQNYLLLMPTCYLPHTRCSFKKISSGLALKCSGNSWQGAEFAARTYLLLGKELFLSRKHLKYIILALCMIANVKIPLI